ncbi:unnamed protein product [Penicillium manginii]
MSYWHDKEKTANAATESTAASHESSIGGGYTAAEGLNSSITTYQDASGAPVETSSPLGYSVGFMAALCLNINQMVGTGIFSTQYASYFPSRSGSEVVYLEQAFPKPKYLIPTIFAAKHVIFSFASSNAVVMAQYIFGIGGDSYTPWQMKGVAVALYTLAYFVVSASTKWSLKLVIWFGIVKILTLVLISIAGLVVLGGHTKVPDPGNWKDPWQGTSEATAYGATNAMVKLIFSYMGYTNAFGVVNEIKNPVKILRWSAPISLLLVTGLYILVNVAYFSAASREEILASKQVAASIFFEKVFGKHGASNALDVLVCLSAFGNLIAVLVNTSRLLRETGRRRKALNLPRPEYSAWFISIAFAFLLTLYMLIAPWYPPSTGANGGDVSFWYGTYLVVGIGLITACVVYYYVWINLIPKYKGYEFRQTVVEYEDGSIAHQLVKIPKTELMIWDAQHDSTGRSLTHI